MASDINKVFLVGRLTRDIEIKHSQGGMAIGAFGIANNRRVKKGDEWVDEPNFFDVTIFGKTAEALKPYLTKGQQVAIDGSLKYESWNANDGSGKKSKVTVLADSIQLLGSSSGGGGGRRNDGGSSEYQGGGSSNSYEKPQKSNHNNNNDDNNYHDDIPF